MLEVVATRVSVALILLAVGLLLHRRRRRDTLPPAPPGLPLFGNIFQALPITHLKLEDWKKQHGPIYSLNLAGQTVVVLASAKVAADVLDKMSAATSGRPPWRMVQLMSHGFFLGMSQYGEQWKRLRRGAHEALNSRTAEIFFPVQEDEARRFVAGLMTSNRPDDLELHATRTAASTVWRVLYGSASIPLLGDSTLDEINYFMAELLRVVGPGGAIVDVIPLLMHLPNFLAPFKRFAAQYYENANEFFNRLFLEACSRKTLSVDSNEPNLSASLNEKKDKLGLGDQDIAWLGGLLFIAGAETTATSLQYFVLAMLLYPDVLRQAQEELDAVVGSRPPSFADRGKLPYTQALVKEVLRWRPAVPLGMPHVCTEDVVYGSYTLPKGCMLIGNLWSICRDSELYPDYDIFRPERFLTQDAGGNAKAAQRGTRFDDFPFGFGRRICVGREVALNTVFIDVAMAIWAFDFHFAKDASGKDIVPSSLDFHDTGSTVRPAPFPYKLVVRSENLKNLVSETCADLL